MPTTKSWPNLESSAVSLMFRTNTNFFDKGKQNDDRFRATNALAKGDYFDGGHFDDDYDEDSDQSSDYEYNQAQIYDPKGYLGMEDCLIIRKSPCHFDNRPRQSNSGRSSASTSKPNTPRLEAKNSGQSRRSRDQFSCIKEETSTMISGGTGNRTCVNPKTPPNSRLRDVDSRESSGVDRKPFFFMPGDAESLELPNEKEKDIPEDSSIVVVAGTCSNASIAEARDKDSKVDRMERVTDELVSLNFSQDVMESVQQEMEREEDLMDMADTSFTSDFSLDELITLEDGRSLSARCALTNSSVVSRDEGLVELQDEADTDDELQSAWEMTVLNHNRLSISAGMYAMQGQHHNPTWDWLYSLNAQGHVAVGNINNNSSKEWPSEPPDDVGSGPEEEANRSGRPEFPRFSTLPPLTSYAKKANKTQEKLRKKMDQLENVPVMSTCHWSKESITAEPPTRQGQKPKAATTSKIVNKGDKASSSLLTRYVLAQHPKGADDARSSESGQTTPKAAASSSSSLSSYDTTVDSCISSSTLCDKDRNRSPDDSPVYRSGRVDTSGAKQDTSSLRNPWKLQRSNAVLTKRCDTGFSSPISVDNLIDLEAGERLQGCEPVDMIDATSKYIYQPPSSTDLNDDDDDDANSSSVHDENDDYDTTTDRDEYDNNNDDDNDNDSRDGGDVLMDRFTFRPFTRRYDDMVFSGGYRLEDFLDYRLPVRESHVLDDGQLGTDMEPPACTSCTNPLGRTASFLFREGSGHSQSAKKSTGAEGGAAEGKNGTAGGRKPSGASGDDKQKGSAHGEVGGGGGGGGGDDGSRDKGGGKKGGRPSKLPQCCLPNNMQPTFYIGGGNGTALVEAPLLALGWKRISDKHDERYRLKWVENKSRINYVTFREGEQLVNHIPNCKLLTNKLGLLCSLQEYERVTLLTKGRLPRMKMVDFVPETYKLDERTDREKFLSEYKDGETWICKPTSMNQGKGIFLLRSREEINQLLSEREAKQQAKSSRIPMMRIVQRYLHNPLLLEGRKFDIRSYMFIGSTVPFLVLYHKGYVRLSCQKYSSEDTNLTTHLTNQFVQKKDPAYKDNKEDTAWTMDKLNDYINENVAKEKGLETDWVYGTLTKQMQRITLHCFNSVKHKLQCKIGYFDLYGMDFMVDADMKVWLIEINANPALHTNCQALKEAIPPVVEDALYLAVECFDKSRKGQPLMPLNSLGGYTVLYCGSSPNMVAPRQIRSVSPFKDVSDWSRPTGTAPSTRRASPPRNLPKMSTTQPPSTQSTAPVTTTTSQASNPKAEKKPMVSSTLPTISIGASIPPKNNGAVGNANSIKLQQQQQQQEEQQASLQQQQQQQPMRISRTGTLTTVEHKFRMTHGESGVRRSRDNPHRGN